MPGDEFEAAITFVQFIAALEVFGRNTRMVEATMSPQISGIFHPETIGDFIDLLVSKPSMQAKNIGISEMTIFRFYNKKLELAAIAVAPSVQENDIIEIDLKNNVQLKQSKKSDLVPDPEVILIEGMTGGASISTKSLNILWQKEMSASTAFKALDNALPDRSIREEMVRTLRIGLSKTVMRPAA